MRVLGIDPGTVLMGYGVIDEDRGSLRVVDCGALRAAARLSMPDRLKQMYRGLLDLLTEHSPDEVAVEEPFVSENVRSAMSIGRAQAIAMLAAAQADLQVWSYPPASIKQAVAGFGGSDKRQMQRMIAMQLNLNKLPEPADAADALAVALCHLQNRRQERLLNASAK